MAVKLGAYTTLRIYTYTIAYRCRENNQVLHLGGGRLVSCISYLIFTIFNHHAKLASASTTYRARNERSIHIMERFINPRRLSLPHPRRRVGFDGAGL